jgi:hypothetical protein
MAPVVETYRAMRIASIPVTVTFAAHRFVNAQKMNGTHKRPIRRRKDFRHADQPMPQYQLAG